MPGGGGRAGLLMPGRLNIECTTVEALIATAYGRFADASKPFSPRVRLLNAPPWVHNDRFTLTAKAEDGATPLSVMLGPMLQALIVERFALQFHRETREGPVYALAIAKGGLKAKPTQEGSCVPARQDAAPQDLRPTTSTYKNCGAQAITKKNVVTMRMLGTSMQEFAGLLTGRVDRDVVDRTGINGKFDFTLEYSREDPAAASPAASPAESAPLIFTALEEQIGVKLVPARGPLAYLVIDRIQPPTEN